MTILKAKVQKVQIGFLEIEGLMDETGSYYVAVPQVADLLQASRNTAARDFKRLLGEIFETSSLRTEFNQNKTLGMSLIVFERLLLALDRKGNIPAQQLRDSLVGLSLHQLFCDAFGVQFENKERQDWLRKRAFTKETFWFMTAAIDQYYKNNPREEEYRGQNYIEAFDCLNICLFGLKSKDIKKLLGIKDSQLNRDHFGRESLIKIEMIQRIAEAQILYHDKHPVQAVRIAASLMNYKRSDFRD